MVLQPTMNYHKKDHGPGIDGKGLVDIGGLPNSLVDEEPLYSPDEGSSKKDNFQKDTSAKHFLHDDITSSRETGRLDKKSSKARPTSIPLRRASSSADGRNSQDDEHSRFIEGIDEDDSIDFGQSGSRSGEASTLFGLNRAADSNESFPSVVKVRVDNLIQTVKHVMTKYAQFIGPGIMVSVAYMDPGNYSTAVSAGALYQYKHLFVILVSNLFAVFLQILCTKLGSVTGLDLAQNCRKHLPRWQCIVIYALAEIAIIATDLAEVVGTAISLNILFGIPLPFGVAVTVVDVLLVLLAYRPNGPLKIVRYFEYLVSSLVFIVVVCFAIELYSIGPTDHGAIFRGFLPSSELLEEQGLYLSCGILGATVMPHSLYLGSGLVQPRLRDYDTKHGFYEPPQDGSDDVDESYQPSLSAIQDSMHYSIAELVISLFTVAIFVNSAILIVAGATLANRPDAIDADLFSIYDMLKTFLGKAAALVFALALLFSGQSAGIVCTLAGQMVSEGFLRWSFQPWIRRLITRALAIAPCFIVSLGVGRKGLADVLNASQVVLSLLLPFVSAPLLYFTASKTIMRVPIYDAPSSGEAVHSESDLRYAADGLSTYEVLDSDENGRVRYKNMSNSRLTNIIAVSIFALVACLNGFLIISMASGADVHL